jgi:molecular chaperone GrpE
MNKTVTEQNHALPAARARSNGASDGPDKVDELRGEIERLKEEKQRLDFELRREREMCIRNLADFDNYRRRAERESARVAQDARRELALPLLEVMDDFERAIERADEDPQLMAARIRAIHSRLAAILAAHGVAAKATA